MSSTITLNHQITLTFKEGEVPSNESIAAWIQACLNCNTNRVEAVVSTLAPVAVIDVSGGLIQNITSNLPLDVIVLDADIEGVSEDEIVEVEGDEVYASHPGATVDVERIEEVLSDLRQDAAHSA